MSLLTKSVQKVKSKLAFDNNKHLHRHTPGDALVNCSVDNVMS